MPAARTACVRSKRHRLLPSFAGGVAAAVWLLDAGPASAYTVEADATVVGQGYSLRTSDAGGGVSVDRRRLTTYLGLYLGGLGRRDSDLRPAVRDQFSMTIQMRVDADFGDYLCNIGRVASGSPLGCVDSRTPGAVRTDPELQNYRPELLLAYIEGQNLGGWVDVRLGRQVMYDLLDFRGLDGAWLSVRTPVHLAIEAWGGLSQNGSLPIDPPLYVMDGTSRSTRLDPDDRAQQALALQPTVGASLRTSGLRDFQGRLSYRRTFSATADLAAPGCAAGGTSNCAPSMGTIEERLSYTMHGRLLDGRLQGWGGLRYDFLSGRFDNGEVGLRGSPAKGHFLGLEYRYSAPTWDGDSIFNVFATEPYHQIDARYDGRTATGLGGSSELSWYGRAHSRLFQTGLGEVSPALGGDAGLRYRRQHGLLRIDGFFDGGYGGLRAGGDLSGRLLLLRNTVGLEGRVMYIYWADDARESSRSHGVSIQGGVRWAFMKGALLHILAEDNIDRFYSSQLRLMAMLDLSLLLGPHGGRRAPAGLLNAGYGEFPSPGTLPGVLP